MQAETRSPQLQDPTNKLVMPVYSWEIQQLALCTLCNVIKLDSLPKMCRNLDSLQKFKAQSALKIVCQHKAHELRYKSTCIIHLVTGILLSLELYTENPDGVGDTVNTFLFPDHSISTGSG